MAAGTQPVRLIIDPPAAGAWNMAVDEALMRIAAETGGSTIRFYQWETATLSLGYFQPISDRGQHVASKSCPVVRRSSGGGAIIHDNEITYSVSVPIAHSTSCPNQCWYDLLHDSMIAAFAQFGVVAVRCPATDRVLETRFLCFQRRACGDVLVGSTKVAGSAQRRHANTLLQHGSLILGRSPAAPELDGIRDLCGNQLDLQEFLTIWRERLESAWNVKWELAGLTTSEQELAREIAQTKFGSDKWTHRR